MLSPVSVVQIATVLAVAGAILISAGAAALDWRVGLIVAGGFLLAAGLSLDEGRRTREQP